ncbi:sigma-70 family RNA polymerase sigma factor [Asanoa sp. NPDC050611]|uniref:sigma-70 family RNA polymerase sigma factor n=1 Tax=Asanoa sp. NPDC050611 TaxID=3157098 RepID=UPI0033E75845
MDDAQLAAHFERHRARLRAVAYRMLGSLAEADDAVQDAWLRLHASDTGEIDNLGGWLTTVVARESLHRLRSRRHRREDPLPDPIVVAGDDDPEQAALLADSVTLALLVVLDRLTPAERLAFVLHDTFDVPFETVAGVLGRTPAAARQLASRARRRVRGAGLPKPDPDLAAQRRVVDAFYAAARAGDFAALVEVLAPDVVLRTDDGPGRTPLVLRGVPAVARLARAPRGAELHPAVVNGLAGAVITRAGRPFAIIAFTVVEGRIVAIDGLRDPDRVARLTTVRLAAA